jgi:hypothetical protein
MPYLGQIVGRIARQLIPAVGVIQSDSKQGRRHSIWPAQRASTIPVIAAKRTTSVAPLGICLIVFIIAVALSAYFVF